MCTNKRLLYSTTRTRITSFTGLDDWNALFCFHKHHDLVETGPCQDRPVSLTIGLMIVLICLPCCKRLPVEGHVLIHPSCCLFLCTGFFCVPKGHIKSQPWLFRMETIRSSIQWPTRIRFVWAGLLCTWAMSFFLYRVLELGLGEKTGPLVVLVSSLGLIPVFFLRGVAISAIRIPTSVASSSRIIIKRSATFNRQRNKKQQKTTQKKKPYPLWSSSTLFFMSLPIVLMFALLVAHFFFRTTLLWRWWPCNAWMKPSLYWRKPWKAGDG